MTCLGAGFVSLITTLFGNFRNKRAIKKEEFYLFIENEEIAERIWQQLQNSQVLKDERIQNEYKIFEF